MILVSPAPVSDSRSCLHLLCTEVYSQVPFYRTIKFSVSDSRSKFYGITFSVSSNWDICTCFAHRFIRRYNYGNFCGEWFYANSMKLVSSNFNRYWSLTPQIWWFSWIRLWLDLHWKFGSLITKYWKFESLIT